jgi:hypothetical protein
MGRSWRADQIELEAAPSGRGSELLAAGVLESARGRARLAGGSLDSEDAREIRLAACSNQPAAGAIHPSACSNQPAARARARALVRWFVCLLSLQRGERETERTGSVSLLGGGKNCNFEPIRVLLKRGATERQLR